MLSGTRPEDHHKLVRHEVRMEIALTRKPDFEILTMLLHQLLKLLHHNFQERKRDTVAVHVIRCFSIR